MRLGEIKKTLEKCLNDSNQLFIEQEAIYSGQAYIIHNYWPLMEVLILLSTQKWNAQGFDPIQKIIDEYWTNNISEQITASQFSELSWYVDWLNSRIPLYYSILQSMVEPQNEQMINIKLPEQDLTSLKDLSTFNTRLYKLFESFNIDGQFEFKWVDKWSRRYEILVLWTLSYKVFIGWLDIAQEIFQTRQSYYESQTAKVEYQAALSVLNKAEENSQDWLNKYIEKKVDIELETKVTQMLETMQIENGKSKPELQSQIIKATQELVKELWNWTEFHLSLNPPSYAKEIRWSIEIDYKQISSLIAKDSTPKRIENKKDDEQTKED